MVQIKTTVFSKRKFIWNFNFKNSQIHAKNFEFLHIMKSNYPKISDLFLAVID